MRHDISPNELYSNVRYFLDRFFDRSWEKCSGNLYMRLETKRKRRILLKLRSPKAYPAVTFMVGKIRTVVEKVLTDYN